MDELEYRDMINALVDALDCTRAQAEAILGAARTEGYAFGEVAA